MSRTITVPDWLNESFLKTVLEQEECLDRDVTVKNMEVSPAVAPGVNYISVLFRVHGKYHTEDNHDQAKDVSIIVKTLIITNEYFGKLLEDLEVNKKEYIAYREFLPEMYKVLRKSERFTAKLLYSPDPNILVLEDLNKQGYVMADRLKQLDFDHCLVCLKALAKFHAASVAVVKNKPEFINTIGMETFYSRYNKEMYKMNKEMTKNVAHIFTKAVQQWEGFEDFEEKSRHIWEGDLEELCNIFEPRNDSLNVINHGDLWTNNIMFKYDNDGNIVDIRLLDFQICRYGTPVTDLLYFLFTSANQEVRENRLDELFSVYLTTLNSVLEQLDCEERLTKEQLDVEVKRCQSHIFCVTHGVLTVMLADPDDLMNLDDMTEENVMKLEGNPFEKCYYGKLHQNRTSSAAVFRERRLLPAVDCGDRYHMR